MDRNASIRILIASDSAIIRAGLVAILAEQMRMCVAGEVQSGTEAVACCRRLQPDIVLLEACLLPMGGMDTILRLGRECPQTRILLLIFEDTGEAVYQAFRAGIKAYLLKSSTPEEIVKTICAVHAGETCIPPEISAQLTEDSRTSELSLRELEVLRALVAGKNNHEISQALFIAEGTVVRHVSSILEKLNARDRTQAIVAAIMRGIVRVS